MINNQISYGLLSWLALGKTELWIHFSANTLMNMRAQMRILIEW